MNTTKDILAKLLATENLTVIHENCQTASFNVRDRILTLPIWEEMTTDTYDHLVGHEVGHALYTPEEGWHEAVCDRGTAFKMFLNIIEDARIEKMIQRKYPGLRRSFVNSYRAMLKQGMFGADFAEIQNYSLIDRINVYFKCGASVGIKFTKEEMPWIKEIEAVETWEQVVDIATRLFDQEKEKRKEEQEKMELARQNAQQEYEEEFGEEEQEDLDWEDEDDFENAQEDGEAEEEAEAEEEGEAEETGLEGSDEIQGIDPNDPVSVTDNALRKNIAAEYSSDKKIVNFNIPTQDVSDFVIGHKEVLGWWYKDELDTEGTRFLQWFTKNNNKSVKYMVKEFEMKKSASEYARTTMAKTGVIDPVKMNSYKFNDDIFRKMAVVPQGKNHGLYMLLDWSGSMHEHITATIHQLLNLVMFCKQVNIPFRVYAFTDQVRMNDGRELTNPKIGDMQYSEKFNMMELFSNKMKRSDYQDMMKALLLLGYVAGRKFYPDIQLEHSIYIPRQMYLGGTPLDEAICASFQLFAEFKKEHRLDIVNTIILSDGDSNPMEGYLSLDGRIFRSRMSQRYVDVPYSKITDPVTKKSFKYNEIDVCRRREYATSALLKLFAYRFQTNVIGMRVVSLGSRLSAYLESITYGKHWEETEEIADTVRKQKFATVVGGGYTKCFVIAGGKNLTVSNTQIQVEEGSSKGKIRTAFKKANGVRKGSRVMLSQFIDMVA